MVDDNIMYNRNSNETFSLKEHVPISTNFGVTKTNYDPFVVKVINFIKNKELNIANKLCVKYTIIYIAIILFLLIKHIVVIVVAVIRCCGFSVLLMTTSPSILTSLSTKLSSSQKGATNLLATYSYLIASVVGIN